MKFVELIAWICVVYGVCYMIFWSIPATTISLDLALLILQNTEFFFNMAYLACGLLGFGLGIIFLIRIHAPQDYLSNVGEKKQE